MSLRNTWTVSISGLAIRDACLHNSRWFEMRAKMAAQHKLVDDQTLAEKLSVEYGMWAQFLQNATKAYELTPEDYRYFFNAGTDYQGPTQTSAPAPSPAPVHASAPVVRTAPQDKGLFVPPPMPVFDETVPPPVQAWAAPATALPAFVAPPPLQPISPQIMVAPLLRTLDSTDN